MRIAPTIGLESDVREVYRSEWIETLRGYIVEVIEALGFACACLCLWLLAQFQVSRGRYCWFYVALLLTGAYRLNQALFFWGQFESVPVFELVSPGLLYPLALVAWTIRLGLISQATSIGPGRELLPSSLPSMWRQRSCNVGFSTAPIFRPYRQSPTPSPLLADGPFLAATCWLAVMLVRTGHQLRWLLVAMLLFIGVGQFAPEISQVGLPGIWFPFGTGVSRAQFAYAFFFILAALYFCLRLIQLGRQLDGAATSDAGA